ncbi:protein kinase [candidate division KSB1 bacterium]
MFQKSPSTLGTVSYMSPEQARGDPVDHRADIWALGVVFYEMLAGQTPFKGEYEQAVLYSILNAEPDPVTTFQSDLSYEYLHLINKALEKDPKNRYQSVNGMLVDLQRLKRDTSKIVQVPPPGYPAPEKEAAPTTTAVTPEPARRALSQAPLRYAGAAALVVLLLVAGYFLLRGIGGPQLPQFGKTTQVTTAVGVEDYPSWRPDGTELAYESNQSGNWDIWVKQVKGGSPVNRTVDHGGTDRYPSWSPDGSQIAFWSEREGGGYFVMPALEGIARKIESTPEYPFWRRPGPPQWSTDGTELAYAVSDSGLSYSAVIVSLQSGNSTRHRLPGFEDGLPGWELSWSPDGRFFAYATAWDLVGATSQVWIMRLSDGIGFKVTHGWTVDWSPSWSPDGDALYYVSNRTGSFDLWQQWIGDEGSPKDSPVQLTPGLEIRYANFSPDRSKLAYSKGKQITNLWRMPIEKDRPVSWTDAEQLTFGQAIITNMKLSPDSKWLVYTKRWEGKRHMWVMPSGGGEPRRVLMDPMNQIMPQWSPDGKEIAFHTEEPGMYNIWVTPIAGGRARQITRGETQNMTARWSPDGNSIAFLSLRNGNWDVCVIPVEGGEAQQLTKHPAMDFNPTWSPDSKWIIFSSHRNGALRTWRVLSTGGNPELVTGSEFRSGIKSPDGKKIYLNRNGNIWEVPVEGGPERQITNLSAKYGSSVSLWAADRQYLYFTWGEDTGDIWVMDVEWE